MKKNFNAIYFLVFSALFYVDSVFANSSGNPTLSFLTPPAKNTFFGHDKFTRAMASMNWVIMTICLVACVSFGIKAAKKISEEQWFSALGPLTGSFVAGIAGYIARNIAN